MRDNADKTATKPELHAAPEAPTAKALAYEALRLAAALAEALPATAAAQRMRMWPQAPAVGAGLDEAQRAHREAERLALAAGGSEDGFWMRLQQAKAAGNGPALDEFAAGAMRLWSSAPCPEAAKSLVELCADAAWRACASKMLGVAPGPLGEQALGREAGHELERAAAVSLPQGESLLGLKMTIVAAMCAPWMSDATSLGMPAIQAASQARVFRQAAVDGASQAYRCKSAIGPARHAQDNPLSEWREAGFDAPALRAKLLAWRSPDPHGHARLTTRF